MEEPTGLSKELVKNLFSAALELPPENRSTLLDERCGGDLALRKAVDELLTAYDSAGEFLAQPALAISAPTLAREQRQIGPYKLIQTIGEGGFGTVYEAEQQFPVRRKVALKLIKPGMDSRQVIARFEAERQALAIMDHPNIAKVFDAGATETGRPYFVMEFVDGVPVTDYCDTNRLTP